MSMNEDIFKEPICVLSKEFLSTNWQFWQMLQIINKTMMFIIKKHPKNKVAIGWKKPTIVNQSISKSPVAFLWVGS